MDGILAVLGAVAAAGRRLRSGALARQGLMRVFCAAALLAGAARSAEAEEAWIEGTYFGYHIYKTDCSRDEAQSFHTGMKDIFVKSGLEPENVIRPTKKEEAIISHALSATNSENGDVVFVTIRTSQSSLGTLLTDFVILNQGATYRWWGFRVLVP